MAKEVSTAHEQLRSLRAAEADLLAEVWCSLPVLCAGKIAVPMPAHPSRSPRLTVQTERVHAERQDAQERLQDMRRAVVEREAAVAATSEARRRQAERTAAGLQAELASERTGSALAAQRCGQLRATCDGLQQRLAEEARYVETSILSISRLL